MLKLPDMKMYSSYADNELAGLLKSGDSLALAEIYNRYKGLLYIFAYKRLGKREDARDIIHELFMSLWEKHAAININTALLPYLYTAVRNRIMDAVSHEQVVSRYANQLQEYADAYESSTDHLTRHNNFLKLIEQEIGALPPKMRHVFEFSRQSTLSRKEVARELGLSEETVKSHVHNALKILKTKLRPLLVMIFILPQYNLHYFHFYLTPRSSIAVISSITG